MLFTALLLANITAIHIGIASTDEPTLSVDPPSIIDPTLTPGKFFSINVTIANVTDLYGFEFKLHYNTTILNGVGVVIPFPDHSSKLSINDTEGIVSVSVTFQPPAEPLTTTDPVTLARIFFLVTALGRTDLDLYDTTLVNSEAEVIPHLVEDGYFSNLPLPPVALFTYSPLLPHVDETVTFNASTSYDPDGTITRYEWDFGDGANATGVVVNHIYTVPGDYTVNLTVTDDDSLISTTQKTVTVIKHPVAFFTYSPAAPLINEMVTFDASPSTPDGGHIVNYTWNFDDGSSVITEIDPITNHTFIAPGIYDVTLTVTDSEGLTNSTTKSITIVKASSSISISASPTTIKVGEDTTISGSITPARVGVTVTISYRLSGEATWNTTTVTTNSTGGYSYTWLSSVAGDYEFKASWPGDTNTLGDESSTITVTVEAAATPPYALYIVAVIAIIVLTATAIYYLKKKR